MQSANATTTFNESFSHSSFLNAINIFRRDFKHHEGVPRINIYLLRLLFALMFVFLSYESWSYIFNHKDPWTNTGAAAWCMWGAYSIISFIGVIRPLKMLPIVIFEIIYKITWLGIVSYPLWIKNELKGSSAEEMTMVFMWVVLPVVAMPWKYFFKTFILGKQLNKEIILSS